MAVGFYLKWDHGLNSTFHITNLTAAQLTLINAIADTLRGQWPNKPGNKTPLPFLSHPSTRSHLRYSRAEVYNAAVLFALWRADFSLRPHNWATFTCTKNPWLLRCLCGTCTHIQTDILYIIPIFWLWSLTVICRKSTWGWRSNLRPQTMAQTKWQSVQFSKVT